MAWAVILRFFTSSITAGQPRWIRSMSTSLDARHPLQPLDAGQQRGRGGVEVWPRHPGEGDLQGKAVVHRLAELDVGLTGEVEDAEQLTGSEAVRLPAEAVEPIVGHVEDL